jgi:hypothetical protein
VIGPAIADAVTGQYAAQACLAALLERTKTGKGRRIDISMLEAMAHFNLDSFTHYYSVGEVMGPLSRPVVSQSYTFECADGKWIAIHMSSPAKFWEGMLEARGSSSWRRPALRRAAGADQASGRPDRDPHADLQGEVARCVVRLLLASRCPFAGLRFQRGAGGPAGGASAAGRSRPATPKWAIPRRSALPTALMARRNFM